MRRPPVLPATLAFLALMSVPILGMKRALAELTNLRTRELTERMRQGLTGPIPFDWENAPEGDKIVRWATDGEYQKAIEHFHTVPLDVQLQDLVKTAYGASINELLGGLPFVPSDKREAYIRSLSNAMKVRYFWCIGDMDSVVSVYEASDDTKSDSLATIAFFDAKLREARRAAGYK